MTSLLGRLFRSPLERLERVLRETGKVDKLRMLLSRHGDKLDVHTLVFKGGFSALQLCALHGHAACVSFLINEQRVNVNHINPLDNSTALHVAACGGSLACVQALVELGGATVNCATEMGFTPLHYAVLGGKTDVYVYLISTGLIDVSFRNSDGITPLLLAARAGQLLACQHLIEYAAVSIEECDNSGCTALHYACAGGNEALVLFLLANGANAACKDKKGRLPFDLAKETKIIALFGQGALGGVNSFSSIGGGGGGGGRELAAGGGHPSSSIFSFLGNSSETPETSNASDRDTNTDGGRSSNRRYKVVDSIYTKLSVVCKSGRLSELEKIIARRPDLADLLFPGGWNCLHICAQGGNAECLEMILNKVNIEVDAENETNGIAPLHIVCRFNFFAAIKVLIKAKAEVNCRTFKGKTPLHFASMRGDKASCAFLLTHKADTYAQDSKGRTALMFASRRGDAKIVEEILQHGADPNICDVKGRSALYFARLKGRKDVAALLVRHGAVESAAVAARRTSSKNAAASTHSSSVDDDWCLDDDDDDDDDDNEGEAKGKGKGKEDEKRKRGKEKLKSIATIAKSGAALTTGGADDESDDDFDGWYDSNPKDDEDSNTTVSVEDEVVARNVNPSQAVGKEDWLAAHVNHLKKVSEEYFV